MTVSEQILSVIPGATDHQRLVVVNRCIESRESVHLYHPEDSQACQLGCEIASLPLSSRPFCEQLQSIRERPIILRQESFSAAVGWFTQSEMELTTGQWAAMKLTVLPPSTKCRQASKQLNKRPRALGSVPHQRILSASGDVICLAIDHGQAVPA